MKIFTGLLALTAIVLYGISLILTVIDFDKESPIHYLMIAFVFTIFAGVLNNTNKDK